MRVRMLQPISFVRLYSWHWSRKVVLSPITAMLGSSRACNWLALPSLYSSSSKGSHRPCRSCLVRLIRAQFQQRQAQIEMMLLWASSMTVSSVKNSWPAGQTQLRCEGGSSIRNSKSHKSTSLRLTMRKERKNHSMRSSCTLWKKLKS